MDASFPACFPAAGAAAVGAEERFAYEGGSAAAGNAPPSDLSLSANTVAENAAIGTLIGTVTVTDADDSTWTFELTDDAGGLFSIDSDDGQLRVAGALDYETATSHSIIVRVTDGSANQYSEGFTVNVTDVYDGPTILEGNIVTNTQNSGVSDQLDTLFTPTGEDLYVLIAGESGTEAICVPDSVEVVGGSALTPVYEGTCGTTYFAGGGLYRLAGGAGTSQVTIRATFTTSGVEATAMIFEVEGGGAPNAVDVDEADSLPASAEITVANGSLVLGTSHNGWVPAGGVPVTGGLSYVLYANAPSSGLRLHDHHVTSAGAKSYTLDDPTTPGNRCVFGVVEIPAA